jgi:hypothetical protein
VRDAAAAFHGETEINVRLEGSQAVPAGTSGECRLNLNSVNQLIFVMVKCGVLFEVRTGFLNNI